jgi:hypothetical protein
MLEARWQKTKTCAAAGWKSESGIRLDPARFNKGAPCQPLAGVHGSHPFEYARSQIFALHTPSLLSPLKNGRPRHRWEMLRPRASRRSRLPTSGDPLSNCRQSRFVYRILFRCVALGNPRNRCSLHKSIPFLYHARQLLNASNLVQVHALPPQARARPPLPTHMPFIRSSRSRHRSSFTTGLR